MNIDFKNMTILEKVQFVCVFLPILSSLVLVIAWLTGGVFPEIIEGLFNVLLFVGYISAVVCVVITAPLGLIKLFIKFITKGWSIGMKICPFFPICFAIALLGAVLGFALFVYAALLAPAVLTVYFYFFYKNNMQNEEM